MLLIFFIIIRITLFSLGPRVKTVYVILLDQKNL